MNDLIYVNGQVRNKTPEEKAESERETAKLPHSAPTDSQRIADLEARLAAYENAYEEGVNNA